MSTGSVPATPPSSSLPGSASPAATAAVIKPTDLRGILKYVPRFQGQIFVVALDGSIVADDNFGNLLVDIAVLRSLGIKVVLVHGVGQQLTELSVLRGITITNHDGSGVTDAATLDLAIRAAARVSHLILEGLTQNSLKAAITNAVRALPVGIIRGVDQQFTGKVERVDRDFITHILNEGIVPIMQPIGYGPDGKSMRINSDLLAAELAEALQATKIIYLTPFAGLEIDNEIRREIAIEALRDILKTKPERIDELVRSKAMHAVKAIETGTPRVHIVDGRVFDGLLNEIFSSEGVGSLIYGNDYQQIRRATVRTDFFHSGGVGALRHGNDHHQIRGAPRRDVRALYSLIRGGVKREELLHRTQQAIEKNIDQFFVFEVDETIVACVTLIFYPNKPTLAELGSLYVLPFYHNRGIGKKMV